MEVYYETKISEAHYSTKVFIYMLRFPDQQKTKRKAQKAKAKAKRPRAEKKIKATRPSAGKKIKAKRKRKE